MTAHTFDDDGNGTCQACELPRANARHAAAPDPGGCLDLFVHGLPIAQGSKRLVGKRMIESSPRLRPWRDTVTAACLDAGFTPVPRGVPAMVLLEFWFPRPKHHYRTGANAHLLRDGAPVWHTSAPDSDKLARAAGDSLTAAGVWHDDAQAARLVVAKRYADDPRRVGVRIRVEAQP